MAPTLVSTKLGRLDFRVPTAGPPNARINIAVHFTALPGSMEITPRPRVTVTGAPPENVFVRMRNITWAATTPGVYAPVSDAPWPEIAHRGPAEKWIDSKATFADYEDGKWVYTTSAFKEAEEAADEVLVFTAKNVDWEVWVKVEG